MNRTGVDDSLGFNPTVSLKPICSIHTEHEIADIASARSGVPRHRTARKMILMRRKVKRAASGSNLTLGARA
jgi:hypothetical protein